MFSIISSETFQVLSTNLSVGEPFVIFFLSRKGRESKFLLLQNFIFPITHSNQFFPLFTHPKYNLLI